MTLWLKLKNFAVIDTFNANEKHQKMLLNPIKSTWIVISSLLLWIIPASSMAQVPFPDDRPEPSWRVIHDAPFQNIPGNPPLKTTGETLAELGFDSVEQLLSNIDERSSFSISFSPDGKTLVSGNTDKTVKLWNVTTGRLLASLEGHIGRINSVSFSFDGKTIVSGSDDKTIKLWDIDTGKLLADFKGHTDPINSVSFSPDGKTIASGSNDKTIKLWDIDTGKLLTSFEGHTRGVNSVSFSPNGKTLVSGAWDETIKLWDIESGSLLTSLQGHIGGVRSVSFSPNGKTIASGTNDGKLKLWDVTTERLLASLARHRSIVFSVSFSPDGKTLASSSWDGTVKLWDVTTGNLVISFEERMGYVSSVSFSPNGKTLASITNDGTIKLWDVTTGNLVTSFEGHTSSVFSVSFSPNGKTLASGGEDKTVKLWDIESGKLLTSFQGYNSTLSISFSPNGKTLASGGEDKMVKLWDIESGKLLTSFYGHTGPVSSLSFSPDGKILASGSWNKAIKLWDIKNARLLASLEKLKDYVLSVAFSPNGKILAFGSWDRTVKLWDIENEKFLASFHGHMGPVSSVSFSLDGKILVSAGGQTVKLWDISSRSLLTSLDGHTNTIWSVSFGPDGKTLASASSDNTVKLWDVTTGTLIETFQGHTNSVLFVSFSPDGKTIASASVDNTVKLWSLKDLSQLQTLLGGNNGNWLRIDEQGGIFRGDDGTFLQTREKRNGRWQPVLPTDMATENQLEVLVKPQMVTLQPGKSEPIKIRITNTGPDSAYWLHLKPVWSEDNVVRLDPPDSSWTAKGRQKWKPSRIAKLDAGKSATLHARVSLNLDFPATFVQSGERQLVITVVSANGTEVEQPIQVNVQSPWLEWQTAESDKNTLKMGVHNLGTLRLTDFPLNLHLKGASKPLNQQVIPSLEPGEMTLLSVQLPNSIQLDSQALLLKGRTSKLPIFEWELPSPQIQRSSPLLLWFLLPLFVLTLVAVFYLRRYRHPLVVSLSKEPALLMQLPPEQLPEVYTRLTQTGRLETVLSRNEVTQKTFRASLAFFSKKNEEERAHQLVNRIGGTVAPSQSTEDPKPNITLWEIRLPDHFPLNVKNCLLCFPPLDSEPQDFMEELRKVAKTQMWITLLISENADYQRKLYETSKDLSNKWVAPLRSELTNLLLSPTPATILANILSNQLTLTQLSPYQLGGGVNQEGVFFGRKEKIAHIMNRDLANYFIVSGRQLGKSSLLKALERRYKEQPDIDCFYLPLSNEVLLPRLALALDLPGSAGLKEIAEQATNQQRRYLFLIDEADDFVRHELKTDYHLLKGLRSLSEAGHCKFILAGFWDLYKHAVLDYQSPLKNFGETIHLGALEADACRQLAQGPMRSMQLEYAHVDLVEQLLKTTGQRANLMSIACHEILSQLRPNQRIIEAEDVQQGLYSPKTFSALKGWDAMTDDKKACQMDSLIVYLTIAQEQFDFSSLIAQLQEQGIQPEGQVVEQSLERLELGFVLAKAADGTYTYQVPLFRELILRDSPVVKLKLALEHWKKYV